MLSRRKLVISLLSSPLSAGLAAAPIHIAWNGWMPEFSPQSAAAKEGKGNGGGNGNGNGGGNGGGGNGGSGDGGGNRGNGNGGGNGGGGNGGGGNGGSGNGGGNGGAGGQGGGAGSGSGGKSKSGADGSTQGAGQDGGTQQVNPETGDRVQIDRTGIEVIHENGMSERIRNGRYLMTDGKGRTIIERRATAADIARLRGMI